MEPTDPYTGDPTPPPPANVEGKVKAPAIALLVTACLAILLYLAALVAVLTGAGAGAVQPTGGQGPGGTPVNLPVASSTLVIVQVVVGIVLGLFVVYASLQMMKLRAWGVSLAGAIVAMLPLMWPCCLLGLPFGIWAIVVLVSADVKAAFRS